MSGIAGLWRLDGRPGEPAELDGMLARLAHRGPDGTGAWREGPVALGHGMLHTTPESLREQQPLVGTRGDLVLVADARIDNRAALCSLLPAPSDATDAELILAAYERWGEQCPQHLLGDFAFAIWDGRTQRLFCARDHFGVKPLYYHHCPSRLFAFASEIKGLLALADIPRRLNETRVAAYLVPLFEDKEVTFYEEILRLPPAHRLTVNREGARTERYWALDPGHEIRLGSDKAYAEAFRELFTDAVRCRLRSAFPVGSMLSGGLDSSSIVCVARELLAKGGCPRPHTFSAVFDDVPECDERRYIETVLSGGGVEPHLIRGDKVNPVERLEQDLVQQDEPFYAPNLFLHWALYQEAWHGHVRVLLDGLDGDTTVSHGLAYLAELAQNGRWLRLGREVLGLSHHLRRSPSAVLRSYVLRPLAPDAVRLLWRALRRHGNGQPASGTLVDPSLARRSGVESRARTEQAAQRAALRSSRTLHHRGLTHGVLSLILEVADHAAAALSIEPRYPFFDRRVAEFCLALPADQKLRNGWTRFVLRTAMEGILPPEVQWRGGKADLSPNFTRQLFLGSQARLEELGATGRRPLNRFVNQVALDDAWRRFRTGPNELDALTAWQSLTLGTWLNRARANLNTEEHHGYAIEAQRVAR